MIDGHGKSCLLPPLQVDPTEYMFKLALLQRRYDAVIAMIKGGGLCCTAIISYLQQKGFPEVALHFVADERSRFNLAVQCGNIEVALAAAQALDEREIWWGQGGWEGRGWDGGHGWRELHAGMHAWCKSPPSSTCLVLLCTHRTIESVAVERGVPEVLALASRRARLQRCACRVP